MKMSLGKKLSIAVACGAITAGWSAHKDLKEEFTRGSFNHYCHAQETALNQNDDVSSDTRTWIIHHLSKAYCPEKTA